MNPVHFVELAALGVLGLFVALEYRSGAWRSSLPLGLALVAAAWVGEDTCIRWYGFYEYTRSWHLILDKMPLMVALIWPFVILSDRRVVEGALGAGHPRLALATGALVCYDASLMEAVSVKAGLWHWTEPGLFSVPIIGILGWGFFAGSSLFFWDRLRGGARAVVVLLAPLITHLLLLATWWGGLRWVLRGPLASSRVLAVALLLSAGLSAWVVRNRVWIPLETMLARACAASLFFYLLYAYGRDDLSLVLYTLSFAPPYLIATGWSIAAWRRQSRVPGLSASG